MATCVIDDRLSFWFVSAASPAEAKRPASRPASRPAMNSYTWHNEIPPQRLEHNLSPDDASLMLRRNQAPPITCAGSITVPRESATEPRKVAATVSLRDGVNAAGPRRERAAAGTRASRSVAPRCLAAAASAMSQYVRTLPSRSTLTVQSLCRTRT